MKPIKSIDPQINKLIYIQFFLTFIYLIIFLFFNLSTVKYLVALNIVIVVTGIFFYYFKNRRTVVSTLFISGILYVFLFLSFRFLRSFFPDFGGNREIIGFSTYFNYPQHFDLFLFFILIMIPMISFLISRKILNE